MIYVHMIAENCNQQAAQDFDYDLCLFAVFIGYKDQENEMRLVEMKEAEITMEMVWRSFEWIRNTYGCTRLGGWRPGDVTIPYLVNRSLAENTPVPPWACSNPMKKFVTTEFFDFANLYRQGVYVKERPTPDLFKTLKYWGCECSSEDFPSEEQIFLNEYSLPGLYKNFPQETGNLIKRMFLTFDSVQKLVNGQQDFRRS